MQKIIIICGPTAAGKTGAGIEFARRFNGEIISADSQQVWRGFDIGTAKDPSCVMRRASCERPSCVVSHESCVEKPVSQHLIDVAYPDEHFDAARFVKLADAAIADIAGRGKIPFVVGGTGMYIRMLVHGFCEAPPRDLEIRKEIENEIEKIGLPALHEELKKVDPRSALKLHPNDKTRIVRALEIYRLTGVPASEFREQHGFAKRRYDALKIGLDIERAELYRRIDERVDRMMSDGLLDEVRALLSRFNENCQPFSAVGYREIVDHLKGRIDIDEAIRLTKRNSRHFAKRQVTWFKADGEIKWFGPEDMDGMACEIETFLNHQSRSKQVKTN